MSSNDKKKIIGAILGVLAFGALIAGATYAWLSSAATVTNGTYTAESKNFLIEYNKGTDITNLPILTAAEATPAKAKELHVQAKLKDGKTIPGKITIKITTTSKGELTTGGAINYAICKSSGGTLNSPTESPCTAFSANTVKKGTITGTEISYTDPTPLASTYSNYFVYMWIDGATLSNAMLGQTYSGYVHASATQS